MRTNAKETITLPLTEDQRRVVRRALGVDTRALVFTLTAGGMVKYGGPPIDTQPPQGAIQLTESQRRMFYAKTGCRMDSIEFSRANVPQSSAGLVLLSLAAAYLASEDD